MQIGSSDDVNDLNYDCDNERWVARGGNWWMGDGQRNMAAVMTMVVYGSDDDDDAAASWLLVNRIETLKD